MLRYRLRFWLLILAVTAGGLIVGGTHLNASTPRISLILPAPPQAAAGTIDALVAIDEAANLGAWEFDLGYDPAFLTVQGMTINPAFGAEFDCNAQSQRCAIALGPIADEPGTAHVGAITYGKAAGLSGSGNLAVIHLAPTGRAGQTSLTVSGALVTDVSAQATTPVVAGGSLTFIESGHRIFLPNVTR